MKELVEIQSKLKAPKGQRNKFGNYNYRSCEDILEAVKPWLSEYKCYLTITDEIVEVSGRIYVKATATLAQAETAVEVSAYAREAENKKGMDPAQLTGATSSYARKYALNGLFCIDDTRDADATNKHGKDDVSSEELPPANMTYLKTDKGIDFLKTKGKTAIEAIRWLSQSRTVTLEDEALIQELWGE